MSLLCLGEKGKSIHNGRKGEETRTWRGSGREQD